MTQTRTTFRDPPALFFFERLAQGIIPGPTGKILLALLVSISFLIPRYFLVRESLLLDFSWLLGMIIFIAGLCLYFAGHTLHGMLTEMSGRVTYAERYRYLEPLRITMSAPKLLFSGTLFGLFNMALAKIFGVPGETFVERAVYFWGYYIAGLVCGMAVYCIYGVSASIAALVDEASETFDFSAPDKCGGTHFIGDALLVFSTVAMFVSMLVSVYILNAPWTAENSDGVVFLKCFWMVFPYLMSLSVLILPAISLNRALQQYQVERSLEFKLTLAKLRFRLASDKCEENLKKDLRDDYAFHEGLRRQVFEMRTWPFSLNMNLRYGSVLVINVAASYTAAEKWLGSIPPLF